MTTLRRRNGVLAGPSLYFTRIDNGADTLEALASARLPSTGAARRG